MANYPGPGAGNSQACTGVAWRGGKPQDTVLARAREEEQILLARIDIGAVRAFRNDKSWRMDYRRHGPGRREAP